MLSLNNMFNIVKRQTLRKSMSKLKFNSVENQYNTISFMNLVIHFLLLLENSCFLKTN